MRLEYVALALALVLSVAGSSSLMLGAGRLYAPSLRGRRALLLPAGALVYIAVPPARDFATSGLENGLVLAYLGLLWWMMVCWSQALRVNPRRGDSAQRGQRVFDGALAFVAGLQRAGPSGARADRRAGAGDDADRGARLAAPAADRRRGRTAARRLPDLPDGLLRTAGARHRAGQGRVGLEMVAGLRLPGQLQRARICCGCPRSCWWGWRWCCWRSAACCGGSARSAPHATRAGWPASSKARPPSWCSSLVSGLLQARLLDPAGRRLHARPGAVDAAVLPAGPGGRDSDRAADGTKCHAWPGLSAGRRHQRVVARGRRLGAVGGELAGDGRRRHPGHVLRHRRRAPVLRAGHRPRASADRRRLSRLPAHARGARRDQQHSRRRAAAAVGQLRPVGRRARDTAASAAVPHRRETAESARTPCSSPTWACSA